MAKWYGKVGYVISVEKRPGVWAPQPVEHPYYGDQMRPMAKWQQSGNVNDDLNMANQISIVADPFAYENFSSIKYVEFMGAMWKVTSIEIQHPRLILTIGGIYNGQRPDVAK